MELEVFTLKCQKIKSVFQSPCTTSTTPTVAFYLEPGEILMKYLLKGRRMMYLWTILQKYEDELVRKVYNAQKQFRVKYDWIEDVDEVTVELTNFVS